MHRGGRRSNDELIVQGFNLQVHRTDGEVTNVQVFGDPGRTFKQVLQGRADLNVKLFAFTDLVLNLANVRHQQVKDVGRGNIGGRLRHNRAVANRALRRRGNTQTINFRNDLFIQEHLQGVSNGQSHVGFVHVIPTDGQIPSAIPLKGFGFPFKSQVTRRGAVSVHRAKAVSRQFRNLDFLAAFPNNAGVAVFHPHGAGKNVELFIKDAVEHRRVIDGISHFSTSFLLPICGKLIEQFVFFAFRVCPGMTGLF